MRGRGDGRSKRAVRWACGFGDSRVPLAKDKEPAGRGSFKTVKGGLVIDK